MILAGVDEAGYGPVLGPLVTARVAMRLEGEVAAVGGGWQGASSHVPDVWQRLRGGVSRTRDRSGRRLHVADSKAIYTPAAGVGALERGVLAFAAAGGMDVKTLEGLIGSLDAGAWGHLHRHPWYHEPTPHPMSMAIESVGPIANGLAAAMRAGGVLPGTGAQGGTLIAARVIPEGRYNDLVRKTRNKASVLFMHVAELLDGLLRDLDLSGERDLMVVADRLGGRSHYGELLRTMFAEWRLGVVAETEGEAVYELSRASGTAREVRAVVCFREKGESVCLPTALASMVCKYVREALMGRFNAWWAKRVPGVAPTAGYYTDGMRFLREIAEARERLGVAEAELVRER